MQDIRSIFSIAYQKAAIGDFQAALTYYETAYTESQKKDYIPGMFCSSKRLGDIYYYTKNYEYAINWYNYADSMLCKDYLEDKIIQKAALEIWNHAVTICKIENKDEQADIYSNKIKSIEQRDQSSPMCEDSSASLSTEKQSNYNSIIKKQEAESKLYDSFFNSCKKNSLSSVLRCIHKGIDVNRINPQSKYTALHCACWKGNMAVVQALLRHGADMHILNSEGETCLQCAEINKQTAIVELLKRVEAEGIAFLGPCAECQKLEKKSKDLDLSQN